MKFQSCGQPPLAAKAKAIMSNKGTDSTNNRGFNLERVIMVKMVLGYELRVTGFHSIVIRASF
jgi:hypothetical protein